MCGICGIYGSSDLKRIQAMVGALDHRGPDAKDWKAVAGNHTLGGAKLHITGSASPFPYYRGENGHNVLLNGEIYNFRHWQQELQKEGYVFNTGTDTEVVWALYHRFGLDFVDKLEGMYAIAVLDGDQLTLVRDPMGIKPLYYLRQNNKLYFASEQKSIIRVMPTQQQLDLSSLQEIITFGYIFSQEKTLFRGIEQVRPGEIVTFRDGSLNKTSFSQLPKPFLHPGSESDYCVTKEKLKNKLLESMETILGHDMYGKGVFLSGGVDSSLMAVLAKETAGTAKTFTLVDGENAPDLIWSRRVAGAIKSNHHEFTVHFQDYIKELPHFVYHYENVVAGGVFDIQGGMAFHLLCKKAAEHIKVALTGEGADELFGGYYWIYTHPLGFSDRVKNQLAKALSPLSNCHLQDLADRLFPLPEDQEQYCLNVFEALLKGGLSNYRLWSVDRSCGAFGFEIRPFYLHDEIVDFAVRIPVDYKISAQKKLTKIILKEIASEMLEKYGLESLPDRQKYGMPSALSNIDGLFQEYVESKISDAYWVKHPFRPFLFSKTEVLMFDLFYYFFVFQSACYQELDLDEMLEGGFFESMYT